jgi:hypothetical protein
MPEQFRKKYGNKVQSFLQNPVGFAEALAVFRPTAYKTAFF